LDKYYQSWASKKQDNESGFCEAIGDDDSYTTTNILISKETDLKIKLDPSKIKVYNKTKRLKCWFNTEAPNMMESLISGRESIFEGENVALFIR
jgi:hypothetical protein